MEILNFGTDGIFDITGLIQAGTNITITGQGTQSSPYIINSTSSSTPGGSTTQLQYNNAGAFGGISGATTNGTAVTYTANNLIAADITASGSGGFLIQANNGTDVALFGAGGGTGATFYGGVNIDGQTRLATSLTGLLKASSGVISIASAGTDYVTPSDLSVYVPYTGATQDVDLGGFHLIAAKIIGTGGSGGSLLLGSNSAGDGIIYIGSSLNSSYNEVSESLIINQNITTQNGFIDAKSQFQINGEFFGTQTRGTHNLLVGKDAGAVVQANSGSDNTILGYSSATGLTDGVSNTVVGNNAGNTIATKNYNTLIGFNTDVTNSNTTGAIALGAFSFADTGEFVAGSGVAEITDVYFGKGKTDSAPGNTTIHATGGSGTNQAGGKLLLYSGIGTGNAVSASLYLGTSVVGASGTTPQATQDNLILKSNLTNVWLGMHNNSNALSLTSSSPTLTDGNATGFTPTLTNTTNISASTFRSFRYSRLGNTTFYTLTVDIDPTTTLSPCKLEFTVPFSPNFTSIYEGGGVGSTDVQLGVGRVEANTTNDTLVFIFTPTTVTNQTYCIIGSYDLP